MLTAFTLMLAYLLGYFIFTLLGLGFSRFIFASRTYLTTLLAPFFGVTLFCVISNALMNYLPGVMAGRIGFAATALFSLLLMVWNPSRAPRISFSKMVTYQKWGIISGLVYLLPLLILGEMGIFWLNGADFTSYAGWGQYFQDYSLRSANSVSTPLNYFQSNTSLLLKAISQPGAGWRIGSISLFAALDALLPAASVYWSTWYMVFIAILVGQFTIGMQVLARIAFFQTLKNSTRIGFLSLFLNTIFWLASAHFIPNLFGIVSSLFLISFFVMGTRLRIRLAIGASVIVAAQWLVCPESFSFFLVLLFFLVLIRIPNILQIRTIKSLFQNKIIVTGCFILLSAALAVLWTFGSLMLCVREYIGLLTYVNKGDLVGIDKLAYAAQALGFIDYNSVTFEKANDFVRTVLFINYAAIFMLVVVGLKIKADTHRMRLQKNTWLMVVVFLLLMSVLLGSYYYHDNIFLVWRACINISPYAWMLLCLIFFYISRVIPTPKMGLQYVSVIIPSKQVSVAVLSFLFILLSALICRVTMIKNIAYGDTHANVFGKGIQRTFAYVKQFEKPGDITFVDFNGDGMMQAGWEFYFNESAYLFPLHGYHQNEYAIQPIENKRIVMLSDIYPKVVQLGGFSQQSSLYRGRVVTLTEDNNVFIPYSSSWQYSQSGPTLALPGLPGKLLLWMKEDSSACLVMNAESTRKNAILRVTFNQHVPIVKTIDQINTEKLCSTFKKGLNTIRIEPLVLDEKSLQAQKEFVKDFHSKAAPTGEEVNLFEIYSGAVGQVNPFVSPPDPSGMQWNVLIPPNKEPFNPHVVFTKIVLEKNRMYSCEMKA